MSKQTIAIVGLGRVGTVFLEGLVSHGGGDIQIVGVAESSETKGKALAKSLNIPAFDIDALIAKGEGIDILFDLTGAPAVRKELREKMMAAGNKHTIIATETIARLVWSLLAHDVALPGVHAKSGY